MRYCLAMEYAEHGDLGAWLARKGAQSERFVRREIAAILGALDALHRGQALHRDLTPFNVFVCEDEQLKLGDFGIATHQLSSRGVTADAFNLFNVPNEIAWGKVRRWQQRDDIYQLGLIAAMLLRGDITSPMRSKDVRGLAVQRSSEGSHPPLPRRAWQAVRGGRRTDRGAAPPPAEAATGSRRRVSRESASRSPDSSAGRGMKRWPRRRRRARSCSRSPGRRPTCWCAAGPTRSRSPARTRVRS